VKHGTSPHRRLWKAQVDRGNEVETTPALQERLILFRIGRQEADAGPEGIGYHLRNCVNRRA
jgi:hypothetical protein